MSRTLNNRLAFLISICLVGALIFFLDLSYLQRQPAPSPSPTQNSLPIKDGYMRPKDRPSHWDYNFPVEYAEKYEQAGILLKQYLGTLPDEDESFYPASVLRSSWSDPVSKQDILHLSLLHEICIERKDSIIPWDFAYQGNATSAELYKLVDRNDVDVYDAIQDCPDIDIYLPGGLRDPGYCEDAVGYAKYLRSRLLPRWAITEKFGNKSYPELCPHTPVIVFNHYWDGIADQAEWPETKDLYMMPNVEMYEIRPEHLHTVQKVICKTADCARRVSKWYEQQGNPKNASVVYARHVTSDVASLARERLPVGSIRDKDYTNTSFVHLNGRSVQKGTNQILSCWAERPDFPDLHIYLHPKRYENYMELAPMKDLRAVPDNIHFYPEFLGPNDFGKILAESTLVLCPSVMEGYGHYINQARAAGATIVTTDVPPMNELVSKDSGVLLKVERKYDKSQLLGGLYKGEQGLKGSEGIQAALYGKHVCKGVEELLGWSTQKREEAGKIAAKQYYVDTRFFAAKMDELRRDMRRAATQRT